LSITPPTRTDVFDCSPALRSIPDVAARSRSLSLSSPDRRKARPEIVRAPSPSAAPILASSMRMNRSSAKASIRTPREASCSTSANIADAGASASHRTLTGSRYLRGG
jgi:hypothetical protein